MVPMQLRDKYRIALLSAFAIGIHGAESLLPSPIPWMRLGLANVITVIALLLYGFRTAMLVTLVRVIISSLLTGTFPGPAFILSLGGGVLSTMSMGLAVLFAPRLFSAVGLSIIGAFFHNMTQLVLAYFLIIQRTEAVLLIAPVITLAGTLTGTLNGLVSETVIRNLKKYIIEKNTTELPSLGIRGGKGELLKLNKTKILK
jgi:heptaprenyl diphosphate synthase